MATKLKKMRLTSVDLVRAGANQKADICLYKSANYGNGTETGDSRQNDHDSGYNIAKTNTVDHPGKEGKNMIRIDKSLFDAEELATYEALIAKASVDPEAAEDEMEKEKPPVAPRKRNRVVEVEYEDDAEDEFEMDKGCKTRKSAEETAVDDAITKALEAATARIEELEKSLAMKEFHEIAKKYVPIGENEDTIAKNLFDMFQTGEDNYNAYVELLEKNLNLVEKSGIFAEIGKSGSMGGASTTVGKVEQIAKSYLEKEPGMTHEQAIAKAWENNPELIAEYDREYNM